MLAELLTPEQITILTQIILIDLVLAGDNAIIIGMVASKFPPDQRKKVIFWGIGGAVILRIILTLLEQARRPGEARGRHRAIRDPEAEPRPQPLRLRLVERDLPAHAPPGGHVAGRAQGDPG